MRRAFVDMAVTMTLVACAGGTTGGDETMGGAAGAVPAADLLAEMLLTPADVDGEWAPDEAFAEWPNGQPGVIPDDQQGMMPTIDLCDAASEESRSAAEGLDWQVFTQLNLALPEIARTAEGQAGNMVAVQEYLLAHEVETVEATFKALRDGFEACVDVSTEGVTSEFLDVGEVGDDRIAFRSVLQEGDGAGAVLWTVTDVVGRTGTVLWSLNVIEIVAGADTEPVLTAGDIQTVIATAAKKLG